MNLVSINVAFRISWNWNKLTVNWAFNPAGVNRAFMI